NLISASLDEADRLDTTASEQAVPVAGTITDMDGAPLPGVTVMVKGTTTGTTTDIDGNFSIDVPDENAVLVFSYVGFVTEEVAVGSQSQISISLLPDLQTVTELVVVGYGTQKKSDLTGAVSQVSAEEIKAIPVQNAVQALQGRAAGVDINSNTRPGEIGTVQIRGRRSLTAENEPLYVVDGVPLQSGGLESFNPNDIESISVLKDASASAMYGSRASNGVVIVTTKKGRTGKAQITYDGSVTFEKIRDLAPNFNAPEFAQYRRDASGEAYPNPEFD